MLIMSTYYERSNKGIIMPISYEKANLDAVMTAENFEIHHSRDAYADYPLGTFSENPVSLHHHDYYEIFFFISGEVTYKVEENTYVLRPGDLLLISPSELHQPLFSYADGFYERIVLWITPGFLEKISLADEPLSSCFNRPAHNLLRLTDRQKTKIWQCLDRLVEAVQTPPIYANTLCHSYLLQLFCLINGYAADANNFEPPIQECSKLVADVIHYIEKHLSDELSIETLARHFFVSSSYLMAEFKSDIGVSLHQYIIQKRLISARQLIQNGVSISDAALSAGFCDYSSFYRAFLKNYGLSPSDYTKQMI